ncbi:phosphoribosylglycinamide formyltransferase [Demequina zhanjiangensis]|uniref:Phosphoribosylglycinamide formyltransferase n=1 Tax=Demequina zhanjiangensis TaxID=3051659 RepID=A0ABT8FXH1_9MICO|nr:phosphoribosylglycinamide formyltransferase [Demequina sp. SYSU T00b26]MDN4471601.1 phosphoribosylglycinamide formyltransferase [Demequina sp. SYSU T00b26]
MTNRTSPQRLVVLVSGTGTVMQALLDAAQDELFGARVVAVISDRPGVRALEIAEEAGLATATVAPGEFPDRATWDEALARTIGSFDPDLIVCAGFMRLLGMPTLSRWPGRIVNTHPALLPAYPGAHAVRDALAGGAKVTGCTVMLVDEGVDTGPILAQAAVDVRDNDTQESLHTRIKAIERGLIVNTVGRMVRDGWTVEGRVVTLGRRPDDDAEEA